MSLLVRALAVAVVLLVPSVVLAQASITGSVKDTSGAVLPGVTVEASSPALIEKVRSAVTDGSGQYRIEDLRPGTYTVTFKLTGFSTVQRAGHRADGIVRGPCGRRSEGRRARGNDHRQRRIADRRRRQREEADDDDQRNDQRDSNRASVSQPRRRSFPASRVSGNQDVGGLAGPVTVTFAMRGGPGNEGRLTVDGLSLGASLNGTGVSYTVADVGNAQEVVFTTAGGLGESEVGGPAMNLVPRQGGNRFSGSFFANGANDSVPDAATSPTRFRAAGLARAAADDEDLGRQRRRRRTRSCKDKLWFFAAARYQGNRKTVAACSRTSTRTTSTPGHYVPDGTQQATDDGTWKNVNVRLTLQATPRNKFNFFWDEQRLCTSCNERRQRDDRAGSARQQPRAAARAAGDVDVAGDEPAAARGRTGREPDRRLRTRGPTWRTAAR